MKNEYEQQSALKKYLARKPVGYMKSIQRCGSQPIMLRHGVTLLANKRTARFSGIATCKNAWCCPVCAPRRMKKYALDIACAIDALRKQYNQVAFMLTLTIPHTRGMSCEDVTEILYNSWKNFTVHGNKPTTPKMRDPFALFCKEFNCKHRVRVGEYTHGQAGWHPHFHCLFWVDKSKLQDVLQWQETLRNRWTELVKRNTLKIWNSKPDANREDNLKRINIMYGKLNKGSQTLYISVDKENQVIEQKSSMYICGWGADSELTGNVQKKASHSQHRTPAQILSDAIENENEKDYELYMQYAHATRIKKHARVNFSVHSGIKQIIAKWKTTSDFMNLTTKRKSDLSSHNGLWRPVFWFTKEQWDEIQLLELTINIINIIIKAALEPDPYETITQILKKHNIRTCDREKWNYQEIIADTKLINDEEDAD